MNDSISIIGKRCARFEEIMVQVNQIVKNYNPKMIILFGSYVNGNPTPESDVDMLVILDTVKSAKLLSSKISLSLEHTFPLDIIVKTQEQINKRLQIGDYFIEDIIKSGKVIYERNS
ncbi:MAG TPA: nucleotidyltransferase domain-containing protein [Thermodesulfovibrionia bacterium]|nr:nucleotidyltransferase domain-containing protein [Thermodesulfovibrionia bacterium]